MSQENQVFDEYANDYRKVHSDNIKMTGGDSDYFSEYKIIELHQKLKEIKINRILDFGCGDGNSIHYFQKYFPESEISGIDISEKSIDAAQKRFPQNKNLKIFGGEQIPFGDNHFDLVFASCVFHHILDKEQHKRILKECLRVLNNRGSLIIFEHNPLNPITLKIVNDCVFDKDAILLRSNYLIKIFKASGFKNVKTKFTLFFPRHRLFKPFLFLEKLLFWIPFGGQYYVKGEKGFD